MSLFQDIPVLVKGAGDLATGVAYRLWKSGFPIVMTELEQPLTIRRRVAFSDAIFNMEAVVEGVKAVKISGLDEVKVAWERRVIPILVDPFLDSRFQIKPVVYIDAALLKDGRGTQMEFAPLVIGLGPGFTTGINVHAVIETNRGHRMGRVIWDGSAEKDTGAPGSIKGKERERVIYSPGSGYLLPEKKIGDLVAEGDILGKVGSVVVTARISGVVRGLIHESVQVFEGMKIGDIDPRGHIENSVTISEKSFAIGGGVLEAILTFLNEKCDRRRE